MDRTDNEIILGFRLRITPDFIMELLSRSWSVKVIRPAFLRNELCRIYRAAIERNNDDPTPVNP